MMGLVRGWLLGITGAAILAAVADGMMPEGGVRQVGKLVCGLVLLFAVLSPFSDRDTFGLTDILCYDNQRLQQDAKQLQEARGEQMKQLIQQELAAYSMDKIQEMGLICRIEVVCETDEQGLALPRAVQVYGSLQQDEQLTVARELSQDLGLDESQIVFQEGGRWGEMEAP